MPVIEATELERQEFDNYINSNAAPYMEKPAPGFFEGSLDAIGPSLDTAQLYAGRTALDIAAAPITFLEKETGKDIDRGLIDYTRRKLGEDIKSLTPDPQDTGNMGQIFHGLGASLGTASSPMGVVGMGLVLADAKLNENIEAGVDAETAVTNAALTGVTMTAMGLVPGSVGTGVATRALTGGVMNTGMGMAQRGLESELLERNGYKEMAEQYKAFDGVSMGVDFGMGMFFGGFEGIARGEPITGKKPVKGTITKDALNPSAQPDIPKDTGDDLVRQAMEGLGGKTAARDAAMVMNDLQNYRDVGSVIPATPDAASARAKAIDEATRQMVVEGKDSADVGSIVGEADFIERPESPEIGKAWTEAARDVGVLEVEQSHLSERQNLSDKEQIETMLSQVEERLTQEAAATGQAGKTTGKAFASLMRSAYGNLIDRYGAHTAFRQILDENLGEGLSIRGEEKIITDEARELLSKVDDGGVPGMMTNNLKRIAKENGIEVTKETSPNDVISSLRERQVSGRTLNQGLFDKTDIGQQNVIPGAERISDKELAERKMAQPLRGKTQQKSADFGLFNDAETNQRTLFQDPAAYKPDGEAKTDSAPFREWFGDSKVVDADGKPLVVYHGTKADFEKFKRNTRDIGMHFGTSGQASDRIDYKSAVSDGTNVMPVYLSIKRPLRLTDAGFWNKDNLEYQLRDLFPNDIERIKRLKSTKDIREYIQSKGYDGVVYKNTGETAGGAEYQKVQADAMHEFWKAQRARGKSINVIDLEDQKTPEYLAYSKAQKEYEAFRETNAEDSYIAFRPEQIKSVFNRGTFDKNDPRILYQDQARGSVTLGGGQTVINLFENANASTLFHEGGHIFMNVLRQIGTHKDAPAGAARDWKILSDWLGVKEGEIPSVEQEEKFARGFEQYLREGKAPNARLKSMFKKFKDWMTGIYKTAEELNVQVPDDVKAVMDRILASDGDISALKKQKSEQAAARVKNLVHKPMSLRGFVRKNGGIKDTGGDLRSQDFQKNGRTKGVINPNGMGADQMAILARDAGYFTATDGNPDTLDANALLEALQREANGEEIYSQDDMDKAQNLMDRQEEVAQREESARVIEDVRAEAESMGIQGVTDAEALDIAILQENGYDLQDAIIMTLERSDVAAIIDEATFQGKETELDEIPFDFPDIKPRDTGKSDSGTARTNQNGESRAQGGATGKAQPSGTDTQSASLLTPEGQILSEDPDFTVSIQDEDGNYQTVRLEEALREADAEIAKAEQESSLFDVATSCFLGGVNA